MLLGVSSNILKMSSAMAKPKGKGIYRLTNSLATSSQVYPTKERTKELQSTSFWTDHHKLANEILAKIVHKTHIVAHPDDQNELKKLINKEIHFVHFNSDDSIVMKPMQASNCHENCFTMLQNKEIEKMYIGYGLSEDDGLWRHHSWGISNGKIVETTVKRSVYVGVTVID